MRQLGMPTLIELPEIEDCAKLCCELGLQFIELNMNLPQYQPENIDTDKLLKIAKEYDIYYTIHIDENFNPCDFNRLVADAYLQTMINTIKIAKKLPVPVINMHMGEGVWFTMPDRNIYLFDEYNDYYMEKQATFKDLCEKEIGNSGIKICIENCSGYKDYHKKAIELLLASPVFGLTFDLGHNHGCNPPDEPFILSHKDKLCHFHFHDAIGRKNHLALGAGEIDLPKYIALREETNSRVVLETKTIDGLKQSVQWIKNKV